VGPPLPPLSSAAYHHGGGGGGVGGVGGGGFQQNMTSSHAPTDCINTDGEQLSRGIAKAAP